MATGDCQHPRWYMTLIGDLLEHGIDGSPWRTAAERSTPHVQNRSWWIVIDMLLESSSGSVGIRPVFDWSFTIHAYQSSVYACPPTASRFWPPYVSQLMRLSFKHLPCKTCMDLLDAPRYAAPLWIENDYFGQALSFIQFMTMVWNKCWSDWA